MHASSWTALLAIAFAAPGETLSNRRSLGCGITPSFHNGHFHTNHTETGREYRIWLPETYDKDSPTTLILSYHGGTQNIADQIALDNLTSPAFNTEHIVVYLQGLKAEDGKTAWQGVPGATADDFGFTSDVLDLMESNFCIDAERIYATGKSDGGGFVNQLACHQDLSSRIAAFAPVSGAYYIDSITSKDACHPETVRFPCNNSRDDIPLLAFHGGADDTIKYYGDFRKNACLPAVRHWAKEWAHRDGLSVKEVNFSIPYSDGGVNMTFGDGRVTLVFDGWNIPHDWPSNFTNPDNDGNNIAAFNATEWILGFFRSYTLTRGSRRPLL